MKSVTAQRRASASKRRFLAAAAANVLEGVLELLPGVTVWAKDARGRFVFFNQAFLELVGQRSSDDVIGRTDRDFFPLELCESYARDDREVLETGRPLIDRLELIRGRDGAVGWYSTSKIAARDSQGRIVAVVGLTRDLKKQSSATNEFLSMAPVMETIVNGYGEPLSVPALARKAGLSVSQLERQFKRKLGTTPRRYIVRTRIEAAGQLLANGDLSVGDIAQRTGFFDQSHFTHAFVKAKGLTPSAFRKRYGARR